MRTFKILFISTFLLFYKTALAAQFGVCDLNIFVDGEQHTQHVEVDLSGTPNCGGFGNTVRINDTPFSMQYTSNVTCDPSKIPGSALPPTTPYIESIFIYDLKNELEGSAINRSPNLYPAADKGLLLKVGGKVKGVSYRIFAECKVESR